MTWQRAIPTVQPRHSIGDIEDVMRRFPREPGEELVVWFERVYAVVDDEAAPRLPYRDRVPGDDDDGITTTNWRG